MRTRPMKLVILGIAVCIGLVTPEASYLARAPEVSAVPLDEGWSPAPDSFVTEGAPREICRSAGPPVLINEVLYDPACSEVEGEFVELWNPGPQAVNICGWTLSDSDGERPDIAFPDIILPVGAFLVVRTSVGVDDTELSDGSGTLYIGAGAPIWTNTGDDALLCDASGACVDYVAYGCGTYLDPPPSEGMWSGPNPYAPEGFSIGRLPGGPDTDSGSDWFASLPTPGAPNENGEVGPVSLNEVMPCPARDWNGDGKIGPGDEWIELFNPSSTNPVDLAGYALDDSQGGSRPFVFRESARVPPMGYLVLFGSLTHLGLNDEGDIVRILDPSGKELDNLSYSGSAPDVSIGRYPDGTDSVTNLTIPTPGETNILDIPPKIVTVRHEPEEPSENQPVTVMAEVQDDFGVVSVNLLYSFHPGSQNQSEMLFSGRVWTGEIPGLPSGSVVRYRVKATDTRNQTTASTNDTEYIVRDLRPHSLRLSAFLKTPFCKPGGTVIITGSVSFENGTPVEGARVRATGEDGELLNTTTADGTGAYALSFEAPCEPGNHQIIIIGEANDFIAYLRLGLVVVPGTDAAPAGGDPGPVPGTQGQEHSLRLTALLNRTETFVTQPLTITGRVQIETGAPAPGALITLSFAPDIFRDMSLAEVWCTTTDLDGIYTLEFPAPEEAGVYTLCLTCTLDGVFSSVALQLRVKDYMLLTLRLSRNESRPFGLLFATGKVLRSTGAAAAGACLRLTISGGGMAQERQLTIASTDGAFNLSFRAPGRAGKYLVELEANRSGLVERVGAWLVVSEPSPPSFLPSTSAVLISTAAAISSALILKRHFKSKRRGA
ncbi:MAG: lamin tail domain-containing protein [Thermoplasmata archaeon]